MARLQESLEYVILDKKANAHSFRSGRRAMFPFSPGCKDGTDKAILFADAKVRDFILLGQLPKSTLRNLQVGCSFGKCIDFSISGGSLFIGYLPQYDGVTD